MNHHINIQGKAKRDNVGTVALATLVIVSILLVAAVIDLAMALFR